MSLQRRLILAITVLLACLLAANIVVTVYNARLNIYEQLQVHAQDTATSLGFSISQLVNPDDVVQISSMIDVIFDRGYYHSITYHNLDGEYIAARELPVVVNKVPDWFVRWLHLPQPSGKSVVSSGWLQLGEIVVVSHSGFAYQDLWRSFTEQFWLFLLTLVSSYGLLLLGLPFILRPLCQLEEQADAIARREFKVQPLPVIPEFRRVVFAMNRMVEKVQSMFTHQVELNDRLHHQLRTDEVTGLSNRKDFDERLCAYLASERASCSGVLMLIQVGDLQQVNRESGRIVGDAYLKAIASYLTSQLSHYPDALCSRHSGVDFVLFIPALTATESQQIMKQVYSGLQALEWRSDEIQPIYIGVVYGANIKEQVQVEGLGLLLSLADASLNSARTDQQGGYDWQLLSTGKNESVLEAGEWATLIESALSRHSFRFRFQPVWRQTHGQKRLLSNELLTQLLVGETEYLASVFIPMAMRLQLMPQLDAKMFEAIFADSFAHGFFPGSLCVNISTASIESEVFVALVKRMLVRHPAIASRLIFELPANSLAVAQESVRTFTDMIKSFNAQLSLHHFGRGTAEFSYMQSLPLDYLKIDRCFIQNIVDDMDAQFFVRSLVSIAQSCDVVVLAEGVETEQQWQQLIDLGIQGGQGYWLGKPQAEPVIA